MRRVFRIKSVILFFLIIVFMVRGSLAQEASNLLIKKKSLTLELARKIASACEGKAKELGFSVGIVVLDEAGNLKLAHLMDNQSVTSLDWAKAKALSAFEFKQPTSKGEFRVWNIGDKTMVLGVSGGVPLLGDGSLLGAIGISGTKGKEDDSIATAGTEEFNKVFKK